MKEILAQIDGIFVYIAPVSDMLWTFPRNFDWYKGIPILGEFPFAILLLMGMGVYFTIRTRCVQFRFFKRAIDVLTRKVSSDVGVSQMAAFLLSTAMRVGPGNIVGVTGAISVGGPGALFWMWLSALFGMSSSFIESTLSQLFKEKDGDEYVGGLPYYGQKLMGGRKWVGYALSLSFITYAMLSLLPQTFHVFTATGTLISTVTGVASDRQSTLYYALAIILIVCLALSVFGGIKRVTKVTDRLVPAMAIIYGLIVIVILVININRFPGFIAAVFKGAFKPETVFGGLFGVALSQGIKRGLLSNEAGQGTITMSAAVAEAHHPCEQGFIQALGVFLDTIIICTLSGFVVGAACLWDVDAANWGTLQASKIDVFLESLKTMVPGTAMDGFLAGVFCFCYALFAFTTILGLVSFAVIAGTRISKGSAFVNAIRVIGVFIFVPLGTLFVLAGLELDGIWYITDLINIALVFANAPIILIGAKYVMKALNNYEKGDGRRFVAADIGLESDIWTVAERDRIEGMNK